MNQNEEKGNNYGLFLLYFFLFVVFTGSILGSGSKISSALRLIFETLVFLGALVRVVSKREKWRSTAMSISVLRYATANLFTLFIITTIQIVVLHVSSLSPGDVFKRSLYYFFILLAIRSNKPISQKNLLFFSTLVILLNFPFIISAYSDKGLAFKASENLTPLLNADDTALVFSILFAWHFYQWTCNSFSKITKWHIAICGTMIVYISILRVFAALAFCAVIILMSLGKQYQSKLRTNLLRNSSIVFMVPIFLLIKRASDLNLAASQGNSYLFQNNLSTFGNGRLGAWLEVFTNYTGRDIASFLFGSGLGSDIQFINIWGKALQSHSIILTWLLELGLIGALLSLFFFIRFLIKLPPLPRIIMLATFTSSSITNGIIGFRTLPAAFLALFFAQSNFFDSPKQKTSVSRLSDKGAH